MAGTGLLPEDLAPPMATHLPVASPISVAVSTVRARHQAGQEALGPTGQTLPAARPRVTVSPARTHRVAPCGPDRGLQQLVGAVIEGGRQLHVEAVKHHGAGLGLWWDTQEQRNISNFCLHSRDDVFKTMPRIPDTSASSGRIRSCIRSQSQPEQWLLTPIPNSEQKSNILQRYWTTQTFLFFKSALSVPNE